MASYPQLRLRRLRQNPSIRRMLEETVLSPADFIAPLFVVPGRNIKKEISSLPGQAQLSVDIAVDEAKRFRDLGVPALILFGIPEYKDAEGTGAISDNGVVQTALRAIKEQVPDIALSADLCFCEYTDHGHCGIVRDQGVDNDLTLEALGKQAVSLAKNGADIVAPSGMMDGMVRKIRSSLDSENLKDTIIMSYAAKYSSAMYGPFRDAADCAPSFGDRSSYQMNAANKLEALREVKMDVNEGADIVMVKPAHTYLDIIAEVKSNFGLPTAAYHVSGEYSMLHAASAVIDFKQALREVTISIKRAGADMIVSYGIKELLGK